MIFFLFNIALLFIVNFQPLKKNPCLCQRKDKEFKQDYSRFQ